MTHPACLAIRAFLQHQQSHLYLCISERFYKTCQRSIGSNAERFSKCSQTLVLRTHVTMCRVTSHTHARTCTQTHTHTHTHSLTHSLSFFLFSFLSFFLSFILSFSLSPTHATSLWIFADPRDSLHKPTCSLPVIPFHRVLSRITLPHFQHNP